MPVLASLRLLLLVVAGIAAVLVAIHLATGAPVPPVKGLPWGSPSAPPAMAPFALPSPSIGSSSGANPIPDLGGRINEETGAVARGQMSILDELEKAIADQIRGIIQRVERR